jgi:hypothetical protein
MMHRKSGTLGEREREREISDRIFCEGDEGNEGKRNSKVIVCFYK